MARLYTISGKILYDKEGANRRDTVISAIRKGASLDYADLSEINLSSIKFDGVSLVAVDFSRSELRGCSFARTDLVAAKFNYADASGASFINSDLLTASFECANLETAYFRSTRFESADFSGSNLWGATFLNSCASRAIMSCANIYDTDFTGTDLKTVDFSGAVVGFCDEVRGRRRAKLVKALNKGELVVNKYGWRIDLAGPGRPTEWNSSWGTLMICVDKKEGNNG